MDRPTELDHTLARLMRGGAIRPAIDGAPDSFLLALHSLELVWLSDFDAAARCAARAVADARDPDARALARAAASIAKACCTDLEITATLNDPLSAALADPAPLTAALARPVWALLAEGALAGARLDLATPLLARMRATDGELFGVVRHPFAVFICALEARASMFRGDVSQARVHADAGIAAAEGAVPTLFARGCAALVAGSADERARTRALIAEVERSDVPIVDAVTRGCRVLAAFAAIAIGEHGRASRLIVLAGGDEDLSHLRIIDRAWGFEMLVAEAASRGDARGAARWHERAQVLARHPMATASLDRMASHRALLDGSFDTAIAVSERSARDARRQQRGVEAIEAEILLARSRIAAHRSGDAARALTDLAASALDSGHRSARRAAGRELRRIGRRLPPAAPGWAGLSTREQEVAALLARGLSNAQIARAMFVSEATVRVHVSRILRTLGVPTRSAIGAADPSPSAAKSLPPLTRRQRAVAELIATGATNKHIAAKLGIGVPTVEKHVAAVFARWGVGSRAEVARLVRQEPPTTAA